MRPGFFRSSLVDGGAEAGAIVQMTLIADILGDAGAVFFSSSGIAPGGAAAVSLDPTDPTVSFGVVVQPVGDASTSWSPFPAGDVIALPLATIQMLSSWTTTTDASPSGFQLGQSYTFVLVGDPAAQPLTLQGPDGGAPVGRTRSTTAAGCTCSPSPMRS